MIRVYYLPIQIINGTEAVVGAEFIHDALLYTTSDPNFRMLIMDTTPEEDQSLTALAAAVQAPTQAQRDLYNSQVEIIPPDPDTIRAEELLATSPKVLTMPEMWELLRIIGRRLGYRFD